jgi:hypothetical protein
MCISPFAAIPTSPYHVIDRSGSRFRLCLMSCFPVIHGSALLDLDLDLVAHVDLEVDLLAHVDVAYEQRILPGQCAADADVSKLSMKCVPESKDSSTKGADPMRSG